MIGVKINTNNGTNININNTWSIPIKIISDYLFKNKLKYEIDYFIRYRSIDANFVNMEYVFTKEFKFHEDIIKIKLL